ncbi:hypothetical protein Tcan_01620 [Toxocara canis]|uniref:Uncharacterized protein n=1 Tax=Toxocara canis TaxID=6265 RepID=A0A0B2UVH0_TOXCA|nr:hypothetical protein Tcan_01620 [Toxocara canis]
MVINPLKYLLRIFRAIRKKRLYFCLVLPFSVWIAVHLFIWATIAEDRFYVVDFRALPEGEVPLYEYLNSKAIRGKNGALFSALEELKVNRAFSKPISSHAKRKFFLASLIKIVNKDSLSLDATLFCFF